MAAFEKGCEILRDGAQSRPLRRILAAGPFVRRAEAATHRPPCQGQKASGRPAGPRSTKVGLPLHERECEQERDFFVATRSTVKMCLPSLLDTNTRVPLRECGPALGDQRRPMTWAKAGRECTGSCVLRPAMTATSSSDASRNFNGTRSLRWPANAGAARSSSQQEARQLSCYRPVRCSACLIRTDDSETGSRCHVALS